MLSSYTKASIVASLIFVLEKKTDFISAPHALVYFGIVIFFVYFKAIILFIFHADVYASSYIENSGYKLNDVPINLQLSALLLGIHDPFVPFENLFCAIFFGGVWDSMQRAVSGKKADAAAETTKASKSRSSEDTVHESKKSK